MPFLLLYWKWIALALIVGALAVAYNLHVNRLIDAAVTKAVTERDSEWRKSEQEAIDKANAAARKTEAEHALALAAIQKQAQQEAADAKAKHDRDVANARSGALSLRVPANCPSAVNVPGAPSPAARGDGPATVELPRETTASLYSLADDADATADQLRACQAVILSDRKKP